MEGEAPLLAEEGPHREASGAGVCAFIWLFSIVSGSLPALLFSLVHYSAGALRKNNDSLCIVAGWHRLSLVHRWKHQTMHLELVLVEDSDFAEAPPGKKTSCFVLVPVIAHSLPPSASYRSKS